MIHYFSFFLSLSLTLFLYLCLWSFMRSGMDITHYIGLACALKNFLFLSLFNISVLFRFFLSFLSSKTTLFLPKSLHALTMRIMCSLPLPANNVQLTYFRATNKFASGKIYLFIQFYHHYHNPIINYRICAYQKKENCLSVGKQ